MYVKVKGDQLFSFLMYSAFPWRMMPPDQRAKTRIQRGRCYIVWENKFCFRDYIWLWQLPAFFIKFICCPSFPRNVLEKKIGIKISETIHVCILPIHSHVIFVVVFQLESLTHASLLCYFLIFPFGEYLENWDCVSFLSLPRSICRAFAEMNTAQESIQKSTASILDKHSPRRGA